MNIIIADDHSLILEGCFNILVKAFNDSKILKAESKEELYHRLATDPIDILLQDIRFGKYDAREFISEIRTKYPDLKIIIISTYTDELTVNSLLIKGVHGFVSKSDDSNELIKAINTVIKGETYLSSDIKYNTGVTRAQSTSQLPDLTNREKEVLRCIMNGATIKQTAEQLFLSEKTIETYRANLFLKFDASNVALLVKKAIMLGFI